VTVGEGIDDLQPFDADMFARALFEDSDSREEDFS
jgi:signal recognition particle GTPase